jgi:hypothetical protein
MQRSEEFQTDQIHLAAYLMAKGISLLRLERSGRFGLFYFPAKQARLEADSFIQGKALIEPKAFTAAIRDLRARVDELRAGNSAGVRK